MKKLITPEQANKIATKAFEAEDNKSLPKLFVTADGQCFSEKGKATSHAFSLKHDDDFKGYDPIADTEVVHEIEKTEGKPGKTK